MAAALFPHHAAACPEFVRHKDIMISPKTLHAYNVPFVQVRPRVRRLWGGRRGGEGRGGEGRSVSAFASQECAQV
jgi:hypothetical protein